MSAGASLYPAVVRAAGAVVTRKGGEVLLVHRPKYDDWSFPKGKLDPGEHALAAAVREVGEETGLDVRLGPALAPQRYPMANGRPKWVDYWTGRVIGEDDVSCYLPNAEIDGVEWVAWEDALERLTYPHDRETLREARPLRRKTRALIVLRHGQALPRQEWTADDRQRPLTDFGATQAQLLVPMLAAFDVSSVHTSSSVRCVETVTPYVAMTGCQVDEHDELSEEDACAENIVDLVDSLLQEPESTVLCTHRPVLSTVLDALETPDPKLAPGAMLVVHHRRGRVVAVEVHSPTPSATRLP